MKTIELNEQQLDFLKSILETLTKDKLVCFFLLYAHLRLVLVTLVFYPYYSSSFPIIDNLPIALVVCENVSFVRVSSIDFRKSNCCSFSSMVFILLTLGFHNLLYG